MHRERITLVWPYTCVLWATLASVVLPHAATAQRVLGPGADATVLPRGMVRVTVNPTWGRYHERFADGAGRNSKGTVESLAADFDVDSLGISRFPALAAVNTSLQSILGGTGNLPLSLGRLQTRFDAAVTSTPISVEYGVTRRIMLGVMMPVVKTRTEISLNANPGGSTGNMGVNPAFFGAATRATNQQVVQEITAAALALQQLLQSCAGSSAASCSAVNADRQGAQALVSAATAAATGIENTYGVSAAKPGSRYAPVARSSVQQIVDARIANLALSLAGFLGAPTTGSSWITSRPAGAPPLAFADFQRVLTDSSFGIDADSLVSVELSRLGDVELGAKVLLLDSFGGQQAQRAPLGGFKYRLAVGGVWRLGTGLRDSVDHFADVGTGDGQRDIEGRAFLDLLFGRRLWASVAARYTVQQADAIVRRIPVTPHDPFPPASRRTTVERDLGDILAIDVSPHFVITSNFALGGTWQYVNKAADAYRVVSEPQSSFRLDESPLVVGTARMEQRALASLTYSNLAQYFRGNARSPMEVSLTYGRTFSGNGNAPKQSITAVMLRVYNQLF